jgi:hypothetical protein
MDWNEFRDLPTREEVLGSQYLQMPEQLLTRYLTLPIERRGGEFATVAAAADRVGTSKRTIHGWVSAGKVGHTWRGSCILVWMPSLENYLMKEVRGRV